MTDYSRLRIATPYGKFAYAFAAGAFVVGVALTVELTLGSWATPLSAVPILLVVVGYAARNFRDPEVESLAEPRAWWRMTARPLSGYVLGALFLAQAAWVGLASFRTPDGWALFLGAATEALLGVAFLRSSRRLRLARTP